MKQGLELKQGQKLSMTPQIQMAIKLLNMNSVELRQEVILSHEMNPLLEVAEHMQIDVDTPEDRIETDTQMLDPLSFNRTGINGNDSVAELAWKDRATVIIDTHSNHDNRETSYDWIVAPSNSNVRQKLLEQFKLSNPDIRLQRIAEFMIQYISDAGYLDTGLEEIHVDINENNRVKMADLETVLANIQKLDPPGVGSRSPEECLLIQLSHFSPDTPGLNLAKRIVRDHLPGLARRDFQGLVKALSIDLDQLKQANLLIQRLNPHPGFTIDETAVEYVIPDVMVEKHNHRWRVRMNNQVIPDILINQEYRELIEANKENDEYSSLASQLDQAKWLISSLKKREQTIALVSQAIVDQQQEFFEHGALMMKPLILKDIADQVGLHASTISRTTTGKYMVCPNGIFELKYFFSAKLETASGPDVSSTAILNLVKEIIDNEPETKPLSDSKIAEILTSRGIKVARRTVAKYRERLNIPPTNKRKSL